MTSEVQRWRTRCTWFERFLLEYNDETLIHEAIWSKSDAVFVVDECLVTCGVYVAVFPVKFPTKINQPTLHISMLEMLVVVLAVSIWGL